MAKLLPDARLDLQLDIIVEDGDNVHVCAGQPTNATEAATTFNLATQAVAGANLAKANGDVSGRKITISPPAGTSITSSGTADHVAITDGANTTLKHVTTCTSQSLTSGGTVDINPYDHEARDMQ